MEGKHLVDHKDWLLSLMPLLCQGVLFDTSVNSDFSPGWA